MDILKLR